jgi:hypothetical protein
VLVEHENLTKHHFSYEKMKVIVEINHYNKICIREAVEIERHDNNLNKDDNLKNSDA